MATGYDDAVSELYQAPHEAFVGERGRLAAELKAQGDKTGSARLAKLRRPPLSAWAVNQLWWQAREAFDELFATAERLRTGDLAASAAHRKALSTLAGRADSVLETAGHPATEATLRKVTATLSALAASGSFDPDAPGALTSDRDPPGFGAAGMMAFSSPAPGAKAPASAERELAGTKTHDEGVEQGQSAAERRKRKEERAKRQAERQRLDVALRAAKREADAHTHKIERLGRELAAAEEQLEKERARIQEIEARLQELLEPKD
jgi:hypothetical protein